MLECEQSKEYTAWLVINIILHAKCSKLNHLVKPTNLNFTLRVEYAYAVLCRKLTLAS